MWKKCINPRRILFGVPKSIDGNGSRLFSSIQIDGRLPQFLFHVHIFTYAYSATAIEHKRIPSWIDFNQQC